MEEVDTILGHVLSAEIMSQLLRTSGGRRAAVAVEGAAVMKYSRSSHHPMSQPQGRWSLKGGMERGEGSKLSLWILQMVSLCEFGKCPDNLIVLISGASSERVPLSSTLCTFPFHHIFLCVVAQLRSGGRRFCLLGRRKAGQTQLDHC